VATLSVPERFCGPPGTANGGYLSGRLAAFVDAPVVSVRLRRPVPLERELAVRAVDGGAELTDGDELLATAAPAALDLVVPEAPGPAVAAAASAALPPRTRHPFPRCFGCGPARKPGDGLRALVGPLPDRPDLWAGTFRPTTDFPATEGSAAREIVWSALDCPSLQPAAPADGTPHVLGTITVRQDGPVRLDTDHVLLAWVLGRDGRRVRTASALVDPHGAVCARAEAVWFALST
jgi:hypothetical protein